MRVTLSHTPWLLLVLALSAGASAESNHPWCPPFGLDRVGFNKSGAEFEADAAARAEPLVNPVDLGAVLVSEGWLLLGPAQIASVELAALARRHDEPQARLLAWFSSQPQKRVAESFPLLANVRATRRLVLPPSPAKKEHDELRILIQRPDATVLWEKKIPVIFVRRPPRWPAFGAVATKLRYDAPISIRREDGTFGSLDYAKGWRPDLGDVVVFLPSGSRFVFWRGSCYVPFWASRRNTGLSYEWAETRPPADGFKDCVEPLMDKELRYGRVEIIQSTPSRVHVRWTYQSCDFNYKVWGDSAQEDFYFYPDGFGTRVLSLQSALDSDYELSEFIILTAQDVYPFSALPTNIVDILFLDGEKRAIHFPYDASKQGAMMRSRDQPAVYRVRLHKDESAAAVYFHPEDRKLPPLVYGPFMDAGRVVTPCYWGSHWPLARGQTTGGAINDRIHATPAHNSVMTWAMQRPPPLRETRLQTLDTLGRSKTMQRQTWAWLIGFTDADDARLLEWARSFSAPPGLRLTGAGLESESYALERRAIRIRAEAPSIAITLQPSGVCVNPVFEIRNAPQRLARVVLDGATLPSAKWAWDGTALWLDATLRGSANLRIDFAK